MHAWQIEPEKDSPTPQASLRLHVTICLQLGHRFSRHERGFDADVFTGGVAVGETPGKLVDGAASDLVSMDVDRGQRGMDAHKQRALVVACDQADVATEL